MSLAGQLRFGRAAEDQMLFRYIRAPLQQRKKECHQTGERHKSRQLLAGTVAPVTASVRADASCGAGKAGKRACRLRPSRIRGKTFRDSAGTVPQPRAANETSSAHGASADTVGEADGAAGVSGSHSITFHPRWERPPELIQILFGRRAWLVRADLGARSAAPSRHRE